MLDVLFQSFRRPTGLGGPARYEYEDGTWAEGPSVPPDAMSSVYSSASWGGGSQSQREEKQYLQEKEEASSELRQLLDAVNMSILPQDLRLSALTQANEYFDHRDREMHDLELREGAASILYQKLAFAVAQANAADALSAAAARAARAKANKVKAAAGGGGVAVAATSTPTSPPGAPSPSKLVELSDREIALLSGCLEMVHRASADHVASTWDDVGREALPLLVRVLERPFARVESAYVRRAEAMGGGSDRTGGGGGGIGVGGGLGGGGHGIDQAVSRAVGKDLKMAAQKVTKLCAIYSLVPEAKVAMASSPGLLGALVRIIDTQNHNRMKPAGPRSRRQLQLQQQQQEQLGADAKATATARQGSNRSLGSLGLRSLEPGAAAAAPPPPDLSPPPPLMDAASAVGGANGVRGAASGVGLHMTEAARFNAIATLTNLAAAEPNRMVMLATPGLVDNVARVVHNERSDVARQCAALAIMNLSNGDREHVPELAGNDLILETLLVLLGDDAQETRRNAAVALFNVACADQNTVRLARYRDGVILEALSNLVVTDDDVRGSDDDEARTNAAETLFNMSCSEVRETTDRIANHYGLLENLAVTLRSQLASIDVKMYCAATLRRMAEITHSPAPAQGALLTALVKASTWTRTPCIAEAYLAQSEVESNRSIVARHHGLLNGLSKLALSVGGEESDRVRKAAVNAIEMLSQEVSTRRILAQNEGIMMALTRASYGTNPAATIAGTSQRGAGMGLLVPPSHHHPHPNANGGAAMMMNGGGGGGAVGAQSIKQSRRIRVALKNLVAAM